MAQDRWLPMFRAGNVRPQLPAGCDARVWIYVALGVGILVAVNGLIVLAVAFAARHAPAEPSVEELDAELRALL